MKPTNLRLLEGWRLTLTLSALVAGVALSVLLSAPDREQGIRLALRLTARCSALLFALAFTASASGRLWPSRFTRWQRRNRQKLGVAFAASHTIHALTIFVLAQLYPMAFEQHIQKRGFVGGSIAYAFILLMALTSLDRVARWMGPRAWGSLHTIGAYYIWISFFTAFITRVRDQAWYWLPAVLALLALLLRVVGRASLLARRARA